MQELPIVLEARNKVKEKFSDLTFYPEPHEYYRIMKDGSRVQYTPVSTVIENWVNPFNTDARAAKRALDRGVTKEQVIDEWRHNNLVSTITGSLVHEYGESYSWLKFGHPENITDISKVQYAEKEGWLIPTRPKEWAIKKFWDELPSSISLVGAEFKMHSGYLDIPINMSGTFDILMYFSHPTDASKSGFILGDYKTNKDIHSSFARSTGMMMKHPFEDLYDEPLSHYMIQFACYDLMLNSIGVDIIGRRLIWLKDTMEYEIVKIPDMKDRVRDAICQL